jgi:ACR3 family arsenite efflux pump ArsB
VRIVIGVVLVVLAGASITWAAVRVYGQLAAGEDLDPAPMVVAGVALIVLTLVALLSETLLSQRR